MHKTLNQLIFLVDNECESESQTWETEWFRHPECLTKQEEQAIQRAMADEEETDDTIQAEQQGKNIKR